MRPLCHVRVTPMGRGNAWTYDRPVISSLQLWNGVLAGNFQMLAYGANFGAEQVGYTAAAQIGDSSCEESRWLSRTTVFCIVPAGIGGGIKFVVTSQGIEGGLTNVFSFDAPQIFNAVGKKNVPVTGSLVLTILGINFSAKDSCPMARIGGTSSKNSR